MEKNIPYTPGMREIIKLSKAEAGRLGHDYIGAEHYLLAIIRSGKGVAVQILHNLNTNLSELRLEIERLIEVEKHPPTYLFGLNSDARRVLESAKEAAIDMQHSWIGSEHLLLGLINTENTIPARCLDHLNAENIKLEIVSIIDGKNY